MYICIRVFVPTKHANTTTKIVMLFTVAIQLQLDRNDFREVCNLIQKSLRGKLNDIRETNTKKISVFLASLLCFIFHFSSYNGYFLS